MSADPNPSPAPQPPERSIPLTGVLLIAKLLGAGILAYASYNKMTDAPMAVEMFQDIGMEPAGRYIIGGLEGLAALAMLIPQSAVYGAFLGFGIMCGAIIGHLTSVIGIAGVHKAIIVAVCCAVVIYIRRHDAPFLENLVDH